MTKANQDDNLNPRASAPTTTDPATPAPQTANPTSPAPTVPAAPESPAAQTFPKQCHVRRGTHFQRAYRRRCVVSDGNLVVHACENELPYARLGLSVSRKVGNAVVRNRWKRLLREAFRLSRAELPGGADLIVIPRQGIEPDLASLLDSFATLARHAARKLRRGDAGRRKGP